MTPHCVCPVALLTISQGKEGKGPRYAVYDFNYDLASGEGQR